MGVRLWLAVLLLFAGITASRSAALASDDTLRVATLSRIDSFDPDEAQDTAGVPARDALYEGLVAYAPGEVSIIPRLAARWTVSPDGLTYTFALRKGVSFHSGGAMTSADVLASFNRRRSAGRALARRLDGVAALSAPDPATFVVKLAQPQPWFLDVLAGAWGPKVLSAAALAAHDDGDAARGWLRHHDAGTGAFTLAQDQPSGALLTRFEDFWGGKPYFAAVNIAAIPDATTQALQLRAGRLDLVSTAFPPVALGILPPGVKAAFFPSMSMLVAVVNPLGRLLNDDGRRAAVTGMNAKYWLGGVYGSHASLAGTLFPAAMFETLDPLELPEDATIARKIVQRLSNDRLTIGYLATQRDVLRDPVESISGQLSALGFVVTTKLIPAPATANFAANPSNAPDILIVCTNPGEAATQAQARNFFIGDAPGNVFGLIDPASVHLLQLAESLSNRTAMFKQYQAISQKLFDGGGFVPLAELQTILVYRDGLTGLTTRPSYPVGSFDYAAAAWQP